MTYTRRDTLKTLAGATLMLAGTPALAQEDNGAKVVEMAIGAEDAPVTMIEYSSYTCPHCANFHMNVFPDLKKDYIDTGKVRFVFREVYFDRFGLWAGMLARCTGKDKYFGFVDLVMRQQSDWLSGGEPATIVANLKKLGKIAGLDEQTMETCLQDRKQHRHWLPSIRKHRPLIIFPGRPLL
jgi:protein-disulfide isomerase